MCSLDIVITALRARMSCKVPGRLWAIFYFLVSGTNFTTLCEPGALLSSSKLELHAVVLYAMKASPTAERECSRTGSVVGRRAWGANQRVK